MLKGWKRRLICTCEADARGSSSTPLCQAPSGERLKVKCIEGGRQLCSRMAAMGIYPGSEMELLCSGCGCPCLVRVHGSTLSLGAGVSEKIFVSQE